MANKHKDGFFVGYINKAPGDLSWFLPLVSIVLLGIFLSLGFVNAANQDDPGPGKFLWGAGYQTMTGVLEVEPYPIVHVRPNKRFPDGRSLFLSGQGKRGVQGKAAGLDGQVVDVGGILLKRGDLDMLQVGGKVGLRKTKNPDTSGDVPRAVDLGRWKLTGEICDGKCYSGAMRPGNGLSHKACANFCILGGVPLVFTSTGPVDGHSFFLLADKDGKPLGDRVRDFVAVLIEAEGVIERRGDLVVFRIDLDNVKVL